MSRKILKTINQQRKKKFQYANFNILVSVNFNISLVFISQYYFKVPETKGNTLFYHENTKTERELKQKASNHFFDIAFQDFMKLYKDDTEDDTLPSDNQLRFRTILL